MQGGGNSIFLRWGKEKYTSIGGGNWAGVVMPEGVREISEGGTRERSMPGRMTREAGAVIDI